MTEPTTAKAAGRPPTPEETALTLALADKAKAEADLARAEARDAIAKAQISEHMVVINELARDEKQRLHDIELSSNEYHRIYTFSGSVTDASVKLCIIRLTQWHRLYPGEPMKIVFTSGGGSVIDGMALFDYIQELRRAGHFITTATLGIAASMAGILLQAGDVRVMGKEAWLMIHEASFGAQGKTGEVEDTVEWIKKVQERVLDIFASRSSMTKAQIKSKWLRKDWWISSDEALKLGLIDEIA